MNLFLHYAKQITKHFRRVHHEMFGILLIKKVNWYNKVAFVSGYLVLKVIS